MDATVIEVKDDMQILADFLGSMIVKYICELVLDSLPNPNVHILVENMRTLCKWQAERHKSKSGVNIEYVLIA